MHIKIGSRKSKLALWQTHHVADRLTELGHTYELILIESEGDKVLDTPLPLMGGKGVFTKALDEVILNKTIDIAVHSYKDIPTVLESNLEVCAILKRENPTVGNVINVSHQIVSTIELAWPAFDEPARINTIFKFG